MGYHILLTKLKGRTGARNTPVAWGEYAWVASSIAKNANHRGLGKKAISKARTGFRIVAIRVVAGEILFSYWCYYRACTGLRQLHRLGIT
jgi:hypothetical protein